MGVRPAYLVAYLAFHWQLTKDQNVKETYLVLRADRLACLQKSCRWCLEAWMHAENLVAFHIHFQGEVPYHLLAFFLDTLAFRFVAFG